MQGEATVEKGFVGYSDNHSDRDDTIDESWKGNHMQTNLSNFLYELISPSKMDS